MGMRISLQTALELRDAVVRAESDPSVAKIKPEQVINHAIMKKLDESGFIEHPFGK